MNPSEQAKPRHETCAFGHEAPENYTGIYLASAIGTCSLCERSFCENHRSKIEPTGCSECFSETTMQFEEVDKNTASASDADGRPVNVSNQPLSKDDSETGEDDSDEKDSPVKVFRPVGSAFVTTLGKISSISDFDLDRMIEEYKHLIEEAQKSLDYRRIVHSAANVEKSERRKRQTKKDMFRAWSKTNEDGGTSITVVQNPNYKAKASPKAPKPAAASVPLNADLATLIDKLGPKKFAELLAKVKL